MTESIDARRWPMLAMVTVMVGTASGLGGMSLGLLLRLVQHIAYNYSRHGVVGRESFVQGVAAASGLRCFLALCAYGAVAGVGWWLLYRRARPLVSVAQAVRENGARMPFLPTVIHALLQIVTVGLGYSCSCWLFASMRFATRATQVEVYWARQTEPYRRRGC